jgi:hypothetical protein
MRGAKHTWRQNGIHLANALRTTRSTSTRRSVYLSGKALVFGLANPRLHRLRNFKQKITKETKIPLRPRQNNFVAFCLICFLILFLGVAGSAVATRARKGCPGRRRLRACPERSRMGQPIRRKSHITATESVSIAVAHKGAAVVPHHCTLPIITRH